MSSNSIIDGNATISRNEMTNLTRSTPPTRERNAIWYTTVILLVIIIILATAGNLMVLAAMRIERGLRERYFIGCLAVADLLIGVFFCPLRLYEYEVGITSLHLCRFYMWINIFLASASIYTLTWISCDRYLKISKPLRYNVIMTQKKSKIVISIIWMISTAYATNGSFDMYVSPYGCSNDNDLFYTVSMIIAFFVPTAIALIMYTRILLVANRRRKRARRGELGKTSQFTNHPSSFYKDLKNIRMMAIVIGAFVLCWGPFFIMNFFYRHNQALIKTFKNEQSHNLTAFILPPFNSVCNPIIYACFDKRFRVAFKRLFTRLWR
ncbi:D(2) dopamine receptor A-like [Dendronephthya gigantea]|uniref:D(2) dopamine receptor A-like n=1 Tax=Dendronephthya gigantea TaxID=151771 RepID=UPI00106B9888|nr:D(2) dopamine receptor A-like [Dendronephthya gigantea]